MLPTRSFQFNIVEHAHENDPVWKFVSAKGPSRLQRRVVKSPSCRQHECDGIFHSMNCVRAPTSESVNGLAKIGLLSKDHACVVDVAPEV